MSHRERQPKVPAGHSRRAYQSTGPDDPKKSMSKATDDERHLKRSFSLYDITGMTQH